MSRDHLPSVKALLFDKDGTLFDFEKSWGDWTRGFINRHGTTAEHRNQLAQVMGFDPQTGRFAPDSPVIAHTVDEIADLLQPVLAPLTRDAIAAAIIESASGDFQVPVAPLEPLFSGLRQSGYVLGIATNDGEAPARAHLRQSGIEHLFDFIAGCDSGHGGKPEPGQLLAFLNASAMTPTEALMIGDSVHDLRAGRAAGMSTVGVLTGPATRDMLAPLADHILPSIADLPRLLA